MKKIICKVFGHSWSQYDQEEVMRILYRYCKRCNELESYSLLHVESVMRKFGDK